MRSSLVCVSRAHASWSSRAALCSATSASGATKRRSRRRRSARNSGGTRWRRAGVQCAARGCAQRGRPATACRGWSRRWQTISTRCDDGRWRLMCRPFSSSVRRAAARCAIDRACAGARARITRAQTTLVHATARRQRAQASAAARVGRVPDDRPAHCVDAGRANSCSIVRCAHCSAPPGGSARRRRSSTSCSPARWTRSRSAAFSSLMPSMKRCRRLRTPAVGGRRRRRRSLATCADSHAPPDDDTTRELLDAFDKLVFRLRSFHSASNVCIVSQRGARAPRVAQRRASTRLARLRRRPMRRRRACRRCR